MVSQVADDVLVMYGGRAVEHGTVEQVLRRPQHPYTWGLLASVPSLHGGGRCRPAADPGQPAEPDQPAHRVRVPPALPYAAHTGDRSVREVAAASRHR